MAGWPANCISDRVAHSYITQSQSDWKDCQDKGFHSRTAVPTSPVASKLTKHRKPNNPDELNLYHLHICPDICISTRFRWSSADLASLPKVPSHSICVPGYLDPHHQLKSQSVPRLNTVVRSPTTSSLSSRRSLAHALPSHAGLLVAHGDSSWARHRLNQLNHGNLLQGPSTSA